MKNKIDLYTLTPLKKLGIYGFQVNYNGNPTNAFLNLRSTNEVLVMDLKQELSAVVLDTSSIHTAFEKFVNGELDILPYRVQLTKGDNFTFKANKSIGYAKYDEVSNKYLVEYEQSDGDITVATYSFDFMVRAYIEQSFWHNIKIVD